MSECADCGYQPGDELAAQAERDELARTRLARYAVLTGEDVEPRDEDERTG